MMKLSTSLVTLGTSLWLVVLPACTTINPYTEEKQTSKASEGATIGSVAGAILGAATASRGDRTKMALIGAGIGAIAGGGAGYYMDVQEATLRKKLEGTGVHVVREGNNIHLVMPGDVTFETNSASLDSRFFAVLDSVATVLQEYKSTLVTVAGYTDSTGPADFNQKLSERRASTVAVYLHSRGVVTESPSASRRSVMVKIDPLPATAPRRDGQRTVASRSPWILLPSSASDSQREIVLLLRF